MEEYKGYAIETREAQELSADGMTFTSVNPTIGLCKAQSKKGDHILYAVARTCEQALFLLKNIIDEGEQSRGVIGSGISVAFDPISGTKTPKPFRTE